MSESKIQRRKRKTDDNQVNSDKGTKKQKVKKNKISQSYNSKVLQSNIDQMIENFDEMFLNEDKITDKSVRQFSKSNFAVKDNASNSSVKVNYNNLIIFLLKFSGLEVESVPKYWQLISIINEETCANFDLLDEIIGSCKVRNEKFKTVKNYSIFEAIVSEIYNNYEITSDDDFEILKKFISNFLKLTKNKYRKIRYYSCLILLNIFKLITEELITTEKILMTRSKKKTNFENLDSFVKNSNSLTLEENVTNMMELKLRVISELVQILKEKFIFPKFSDVSKAIRVAICDYLIKISKNNFIELFSDEKIISFYPFFLIDTSKEIKYKYLQLIYEKLDLIDDEDVSHQNEELEKYNTYTTIGTIVKILSVARDAILNICVKEDKLIAKQAVKIIELLSQHNILEIKTVQALLPHLFNPEPQIRILISKVVVNYILNFENLDKSDKEIYEEEDNDKLDKEDNLSKNKDKIQSREIPTKNPTIENLFELLDFFYKLTENETKMLKILVDNFYKHLTIFSRFNLFFDAIDVLNNPNANSKIMETCLMVLNFSVQKMQNELEHFNHNEINANSNEEKNDVIKSMIPKNEEFINLFLSNISNFIKVMRLNLTTSQNCTNFIRLLHLFENFKIYGHNIIKFNQDNILEVMVELKNTFFINLGIDQLEEEDESVVYTNNFHEDFAEDILKAFQKFISINFPENLNNDKFSDIIYSDKSSSLANDFCEIFTSEILSTGFYGNLSRIPSDEFSPIKVNDSFSSVDTWSKFYIVITKFNYMLVYFSDIFATEEFELSKISNFLENLIKFVYANCDIEDEKSIHMCFKISNISIKVIETIHILLLNEIIESKSEENVENYVGYRQKLLNTIVSILNEFRYLEDKRYLNDVNCKIYNNNLLKLKTNCMNFLLEMLIYVSSEKLENNYIKYSIDENLVETLERFIQANFINFYCEYNNTRQVKLENQEESKPDSMFNDELSIKTFCYKSISEKFSRLLLLNLSIFKNTSFSCLFFEAFYLVKLPAVFDNLNTYVYENLMEKEIQHYLKNLETNVTLSLNYSNINVMIFYLTKITMRIFTNKCKLFSSDIVNDKKIEMLCGFISYYTKSMKKFKLKYNKDNIDIALKDKSFFENFIINSINFALEFRKEIYEETEDNNTNEVKKIIRIDIDNIQFFELIKFFLKSPLFFDNDEFKQILLIFLKLSKNIEMIDNLNRFHLKILEKFKNFLLSKARLFLSTDEDQVNKLEFKEDSKSLHSNYENNIVEEQEQEQEREREQENYSNSKIQNQKNKKGKVKSFKKSITRNKRKHNELTPIDEDKIIRKDKYAKVRSEKRKKI